VIIAVVLSGIKLVRDVAYTGSRAVDVVGSVLSVLGMGGIVLGILVWQEVGNSFWPSLRRERLRLPDWRPGSSVVSVRARRPCSIPTFSSPNIFDWESPSRCCSKSPLVAS
jgi:hypothetical protein